MGDDDSSDDAGRGADTSCGENESRTGEGESTPVPDADSRSTPTDDEVDESEIAPRAAISCRSAGVHGADQRRKQRRLALAQPVHALASIMYSV